MDIIEKLRASTALPAPSGQELPAAEYFADAFRPFVDEVRIDAMNNLIAHKKGKGPKVMLAAHLDEIGLMVSGIEDDGSIRMAAVGGVDPRILPACRVWVHGREKLFGTIGALPPHLLTPANRDKNYQREDLYIDVGLPAERVRELVSIGDIVTFHAPGMELLNQQFACKTLDDRACVMMMLLAAERLSKLHCDADVTFVATTAEEVGSFGAITAAFAQEPDLAIAMDVDHAKIPGTADALELGSVGISVGPFLQPKLTRRLMDCAKQHHVAYQVEVNERNTWTDADGIGATRGGVPMLLLNLPLKYMHTTVETIDLEALKEGGRLLAHFLAELDGDWGNDLWI